MNSQIIKIVAGGGKTTTSQEHMNNNGNGIYLAYTKSVVNELARKGYLSKTIDSLFQSFIIPKFVSLMPLVAYGSKIVYVSNKDLSGYRKNILNIHLKENGEFFNGNNKIDILLTQTNEYLHKRENFTNASTMKQIFGENTLIITDTMREELSNYIMVNYAKELVDILRKRFNYIIIDEAQDLKKYRENFAKLIYDSDIELVVKGDDMQNIMGGGNWFENLKPNNIETYSYRCSDGVCSWIRNNLNVEIYGKMNEYKFNKIEIKEVLSYDDGHRVLLYFSNYGTDINYIVEKWKGKKTTIQSAKGSTIPEDIVIIGKKLNKKAFYTAITRSNKNVFSTIEQW